MVTIIKFYPSVLLLLIASVGSQREGDIRLQGGSNSAEGRVEIFINSSWTAVCDDRWSHDDAVVVCKQLNLPWTGAEALRHGSFPAGTRSYTIDDVLCTGDEQRLIDCEHNPTPNCNIGSDDAGVRCLFRAPPTYASGSGAVRLAGGSSNNTGRVEVFLNEDWSAICNEFWSIADARVVCRQLGFQITEHSVSSMEATEDGELLTPADKFLCVGNESSLIECPHTLDGDEYCYHAAVTCLPVITDLPEGSVRLVGGGSSSMSGRLEVLVNYMWGTVCRKGFTRRSAEAVCRQLNFTDTDARVVEGINAGTGPIWLTNVNCAGGESSIIECPRNSSTSHCDHDDDVSVECYKYKVCRTGDIRLVNGTSSSEGRVEMCYRDTWSSICHTFWDSRGARQVCRQLNLPFTAALPFRNAYFGEGNGTISYYGIECTNANVSTIIDDCTLSTEPRSSCTHSQDAGVRCASAAETLSSATIRLVGGRTSLEGRVEVLLDGTWGTICAKSYWNASAAATVCRQLGFPTDGSIALSNPAFGPGAANQPIHMDSLSCSGNEPGPQACIFTMGGSSSCDHSNDASVMCSSPPIPDMPRQFAVKLSTAECSKVEFTWMKYANLQYPNLYYYRIKVVSFNTKINIEKYIAIDQSSYTIDLECGVQYVSFITAYALNTSGHDSNVITFNTEPVQTMTLKAPTPEPVVREVDEIPSGVLAAVIVIPLALLAIIGILLAILLAICTKDQGKFRTFGSHSNSTHVHAINECSLAGELKSRSTEEIHNPAFGMTNCNGDATGLIVKS